MNWNQKLAEVLKATQEQEMEALAARDPKAALDYETRLVDYEGYINEEAAAIGQ
ncbi:hypothetical protein [Ammoniphilus sp. YIM 78166]|uniref:hypothetical protein n=1 Tax=Ammoniphilus sp. YIM 78166 TaxID=1644106 RepID=UPI001430ED11|nr:hypothetical protein [Ammoniphilus sp. YIM 78166]